MKNEDFTLSPLHGADLKPCPCCGSEAEIQGLDYYLTKAVRIICIKCKLQTTYTLIDYSYPFYKGQRNVTLTGEQAVIDTKNVWNIRATQNPKEAATSKGL